MEGWVSMNRLSASFLAMAFAVGYGGRAWGAPIKVACIGEHTTHSHHLEYAQEYPAHLQTLLGSAYEVKNFGDGVGMLTTGYPPGDYLEYTKSVGYMQSLTYPADIVVFGPWGKHDSVATGGYDPAVNTLDPVKFKTAYQALLQTYVDLPSHPKLLLALPIAFPYGAPTGPLTTIVLPTVKDTAEKTKLPFFDLYNLFLNDRAHFKDIDHLTDETVTAYVGSGQEKHVRAVYDALMALAINADAGSRAGRDADEGGAKPTPIVDAAAEASSKGSGGSGGTSSVGLGGGGVVDDSGSSQAGSAPADGTIEGSSGSGCSCSMVGESAPGRTSLLVFSGIALHLGMQRRRRLARTRESHANHSVAV
jgi:acyl-CoA thioesterase-1